MTTLKRRRIGKTKLEVTELGLGGAPMGGFRADDFRRRGDGADRRRL